MGVLSLEPADILLVRGKSWFSKSIMKVETAEDKGEEALVSHAGIFICERHILQALPFRGVVTSIYPQDIQDEEYLIASPLNLSYQQREDIARCALTFSSKGYGYFRIATQLLNYVTRTHWFTLKDFGTPPVCSYVVASAYSSLQMDFGVSSQSATPDDILDFVITHPLIYGIKEATTELFKLIGEVYTRRLELMKI